MENTIEKLEQQLKEIKVVKDNLNVSESEIKAQLKALKDSAIEADKCRPAYYPAIKGWIVVSGRFEGYKLTGTVLENKNGTKKLLKGYSNGKFAHIDMREFTGDISDGTKDKDDNYIISRSYVNGVRSDIPV